MYNQKHYAKEIKAALDIVEKFQEANLELEDTANSEPRLKTKGNKSL